MTRPKRLPGPPSQRIHRGDLPQRKGKAHTFKSDWTSDGAQTCTTCGVTVTTGSIIMPGGIRGMNYTYRDAANKELVSLVELDCPTFIGHTDGTLAETKQRLRGTTQRVGQVEDDVDVLTGSVDDIEQRLSALEAENATLKEALAARITLDLNTLATFVTEVVEAQAKALPPPNPVTVLDIPTAIEAVIDAEFDPREENEDGRL